MPVAIIVPATCVECPAIALGFASAQVTRPTYSRCVVRGLPPSQSLRTNPLPPPIASIHRIGAGRNRRIRVERRVIARESVQYLLKLEEATVLVGPPDRPAVLRGEGMGGRAVGSLFAARFLDICRSSACCANAPNDTAAITTTKMPIPKYAFFIGNLRFEQRNNLCRKHNLKLIIIIPICIYNALLYHRLC